MTDDRDLFGRHVELAAVNQFLETAAQGPAQLVLSGAQGIGKTTLWLSAVESARARGFTVLRARPAEPEVRLAFSCLLDLLDPIRDRILASLPQAQADALADALYRGRTGTERDPLGIRLAVLNALRNLAARRPVMVAIDDVQWLDTPTRRTLEFAVRRMVDRPIGVLLAHRSGAAEAPGCWLTDIEATDIELHPLSASDLGSIIHRQLGAGFLRPMLARIERETAGNPLIAVELARAILRRGQRFTDAPLPVPIEIEGLLRERLGTLGPAADDLVLAVALSASPDSSQLARVVGAGYEEARAEAEAAHVLTTVDDRLVFSHPLLGSVAVGGAGAERVAAMHRRLARESGSVEARARHKALASARRSETTARALEDAAAVALGRGAPEAAAELAALAHSRTPRSRRASALARALAAARHWLAAGDRDHALDLISGVEELAETGDERASILVTKAEALHPVDLGAAIEEVRAARRVSSDSPGGVAALALSAELEWDALGDLRSACAYARAAARMAERDGHPYRRWHTMANLAWIEAIVEGRPRRGRLERAIALQAETADEFDPWPTHVLGLTRLWGDDFDGARMAFRQAEEIATRRGSWQFAPVVQRELGVLELRCGYWDRAAACVSEAVEGAELMGKQLERGVAYVGLAQLQAYRGNESGCRAAAATARESLEPAGHRLHLNRLGHILGFLELSQGNDEAAATILGEVIHQRLAAGVRNPGLLYGMPDYLEALVALGQLDAATRALARFALLVVPSGHRWGTAVMDRCHGLLAAARGDTRQALAALDAAQAGFTAIPEPFEVARTLLVRAGVERRGRRRGASATSARAAETEFARLGARLWERHAADARAAVRGRTAASPGMSPSDRQIAELVAAGRTNREVAAALFMSPHTVDAHLRKIYRAFGVRRRTELAARLAAVSPPIHETDPNT